MEGCDRLLTDATFSDLHNNINILKKAALECELLVVAKAASSTDGQLRSLLENHHIDRAKIELDLLNNNIVLSSIRDALASLTSRGIILEPHASIIAGFIDNRLQAQQEEEEDEKLIISE